MDPKSISGQNVYDLLIELEFPETMAELFKKQIKTNLGDYINGEMELIKKEKHNIFILNTFLTLMKRVRNESNLPVVGKIKSSYLHNIFTNDELIFIQKPSETLLENSPESNLTSSNLPQINQKFKSQHTNENMYPVLPMLSPYLEEHLQNEIQSDFELKMTTEYLLKYFIKENYMGYLNCKKFYRHLANKLFEKSDALYIFVKNKTIEMKNNNKKPESPQEFVVRYLMNSMKRLKKRKDKTSSESKRKYSEVFNAPIYINDIPPTSSLNSDESLVSSDPSLQTSKNPRIFLNHNTGALIYNAEYSLNESSFNVSMRENADVVIDSKNHQLMPDTYGKKIKNSSSNLESIKYNSKNSSDYSIFDQSMTKKNDKKYTIKSFLKCNRPYQISYCREF